MDTALTHLYLLDVLVWAAVWLIGGTLALVVVFALVVRLGVLDTIWHYLGRYLRWRKNR